MSLDKVPNHEFTFAGIMTKSTSGLVRRPLKNKNCQQKNVSQTAAITETLVEAFQKIEVGQKCVERRKRYKNECIYSDKNENKYKSFC